MEHNEHETVAVIGGGLVGKSWAMLFASAGLRVKFYSLPESQLTENMDDMKRQLVSLEAKGLLRGKLSANEQFNQIECCQSLEQAIQNVSYVQECIFENLVAKRDIFARIGSLINENTIMASSTSTFVTSSWSALIPNRQNAIVAHPVNPPYFVPLVEISPSPWTTPEVVNRTKNLMEKIGQKPVLLLKEVNGFALNRIQYVMMREAWSLVHEGALTAKDIDLVVSAGLGMRFAFVGPLENIHLNADGIEDFIEKYVKVMSTLDTGTRRNNFLESLRGERANEIFKEVTEECPLNELEDKRAWRDEQLSMLYELKYKDVEKNAKKEAMEEH